jgi:short-subunit dehydrogenase
MGPGGGSLREAPLAFITGASSGIGQALAARYAQEGWRLALVARRAGEMGEWARAQGLAPERWRVYGADVADGDSIAGAAERCLADQGVPEVVIANAGISLGVDTSLREDIAVLARIFAVNNVGLAATFQPFIAPMRQRGSGRLVGIASVAGIRGLPGHAAYCASKAGVISFCESLRGELRGTGVRVVTIAPGYIDTPLTRQNRYAMPFLMRPEDFAAQALRVIEAGRSYRVIPWQMGAVAKILRALPDPVFDRLLVGRARKQRHRPG